jgi:hypothetical protein
VLVEMVPVGEIRVAAEGRSAPLLMVNVCTPSGAGVNTVTGTVPAVATSSEEIAAGSVGVVAIILPNAVVSDPCPRLVTVVALLPASSLCICAHAVTGASKSKLAIRRILIRRSLFIKPSPSRNSRID